MIAPALSRRIADLPPPIIVFNKSHSGSRLLAELLRGQGVFMGAELNDSRDALAFLPLVEATVLSYYPDYQALWQQAIWPDWLQEQISQTLDRHLAGYRPDAPWGLKLCEATFILPLLVRLFPQARFVHLLRDGRDVAFSDHVASDQNFWRKIYFETTQVQSWLGMSLDHAAYERRSYLYNARHWQESVRVGRAYGAMLGPACRELRYEALCADLPGQGRELLAWLGLPSDAAVLSRLAASVQPGSIGKYRKQPAARQRAVQALIEPTLLACGYDCTPLAPSRLDGLRALFQRLNLSLRRRLRSKRG